MRGPSTATSGGQQDRSNHKGNAAVHGIKHANIPSIAYVATMVSVYRVLLSQYLIWIQLRFTLSSQMTFSAGGAPGRWPHRSFYHEIIKACDLMDAQERKELLEWWDK